MMEEFIKKITLIECLTILFFISVGIAILFKLGFFHTLGLEWYIQNLSPQQIFISSISLCFISILGAISGFFAAKQFLSNENQMLLWCIGVVSLGFCITYFKSYIDPDYPSYIYVFLLNFILILCLTDHVRDVRKLITLRTEVEVSGEKISKIVVFSQGFIYIILLLIIISTVLMPYMLGKDKADQLLKNKQNLNQVYIKGSKDKWYIVDANGDKFILMKDSEKIIYKIVEYKELIEIKVN